MGVSQTDVAVDVVGVEEDTGGGKRAVGAGMPQWVFAFGYSDKAQHKKSSHVTARIDIMHRLAAAGLSATCGINSVHSEMYVLVWGGLERLEAEAEMYGMLKQLRTGGGLVRFSQVKRHLFGSRVLQQDFFSPAEQLTLVHNILVCNSKHRGAHLALGALMGRWGDHDLARLSDGEVRWVAARLGVDAERAGLTTREEMAARVAAEVRDPPVRALMPLHQEEQEELAQAFSGVYAFWPGHILRGGGGTALEVLETNVSPTASRSFPESVDALTLLKDYCGEPHATHLLRMSALGRSFAPLGLVSVVLWVSHQTSDAQVEVVLLALIVTVAAQLHVASWRQALYNLDHAWGLAKLSEGMEALHIAPALFKMPAPADDWEETSSLAIIWRRRRVQALQSLVAVALCATSLAVYGLVRAAMSGLLGSDISMTGAIIVSTVDSLRVCLVEALGRWVLNRAESWDNAVSTPPEEKRHWKRALLFLFTLVNTFGSAVIMVGYQAFSQGARWAIDPPSCYSLNCVGDIEIDLWSLLCVRHVAFPIFRFLSSHVRFKVTKRRFELLRLRDLVAGHHQQHSSSGGAAPPATSDANGRRGAINDVDGGLNDLGGRTAAERRMIRRQWSRVEMRNPNGTTRLATRISLPSNDVLRSVEGQRLLDPYSTEEWEELRPLEVVMLSAFVMLCSPLAPLMPLAVSVILAARIRLDARQLLVYTQRATVAKSRVLDMWARTASFLSLLAIICNSISIMFVTSDLEHIMARVASAYRDTYMRNEAFAEGAVECIDKICIANGTWRAEGALYWILWITIVAVGLAFRVVAAFRFRNPSYALRKKKEHEEAVQQSHGFSSLHTSHEEADLIAEEYHMRFNATAHEDGVAGHRPPT